MGLFKWQPPGLKDTEFTGAGKLFMDEREVSGHAF
jgi:hypothetical protein